MKTFLLAFFLSVLSQAQILGPIVAGASNGTTTLVNNPSASPVVGQYGATQTVTLTDSTSGATICYRTDGTNPAATTPGTCDAGSTTYSGTISATLPTTILALGTKAGMTNSSVSTFVYTFGATYTFTTVENPLSDSGNFTAAGSGLGMPKVVSSGVCEPTTTNTTHGAFFTVYTWPANQSSYVKILTLSDQTGGHGYAVPVVRMAAGASTDYFFNLQGPTGSAVNSILYAQVAGTVHNIGNVTLTLAVNDVIGLTVTTGTGNNVIVVTQNGTTKLTVTDSTYYASITGGTPGFELNHFNNIALAQISQWEGTAP